MITIKKVKRTKPFTESSSYYGVVQSNGQITLDEIVERIVARCTVTKSDVLAVLAALQEQAIYALRNAQAISLGELGTLYLRMKSELVKEAVDFGIDNVRSISVGYRPRKQMLKRLQRGQSGVSFQSLAD